MSKKPNNTRFHGVFGGMSTFNEENLVIEPADADTVTWLLKALEASTNSIKWYDQPSLLDKTNSSLLAVVALPDSDALEPVYLSCNIKTMLVPSLSQGTRNTPGEITFVTEAGWTGSSDISPTPHMPVRLSAQWANYTNPYLDEHGMDVFARLSRAAGLSTSEPRTMSLNIPYAVESIISLMIINGLSRMPYRTAVAGVLKGMNIHAHEWGGGDWAKELLPKDTLGYGGQAYSITPEVEQLATKFQMKAR